MILDHADNNVNRCRKYAPKNAYAENKNAENMSLRMLMRKTRTQKICPRKMNTRSLSIIINSTWASDNFFDDCNISDFVIKPSWFLKHYIFKIILSLHIIVHYSIGFTESALKFWPQISQKFGGTLFSRIFCFMFFMKAIKPNVENKFKLVLLLRNCLGEVSQDRSIQNKTILVSFIILAFVEIFIKVHFIDYFRIKFSLVLM